MPAHKGGHGDVMRQIRNPIYNSGNGINLPKGIKICKKSIRLEGLEPPYPYTQCRYVTNYATICSKPR